MQFAIHVGPTLLICSVTQMALNMTKHFGVGSDVILDHRKETGGVRRAYGGSFIDRKE